MKQYKIETTYYDEEIVQKNIEELKARLINDFEEIFKDQNEK